MKLPPGEFRMKNLISDAEFIIPTHLLRTASISEFCEMADYLYRISGYKSIRACDDPVYIHSMLITETGHNACKDKAWGSMKAISHLVTWKSCVLLKVMHSLGGVLAQ